MAARLTRAAVAVSLHHRHALVTRQRTRRHFAGATPRIVAHTPPVTLNSLLPSIGMFDFLHSSWFLALAAYVSVSCLCLYYPQLITVPIVDQFSTPSLRKRVLPSALLHKGAHRGGACERVENTIAAFDHALDNDCTLLELDVRLTRDKQVVVYHDADVSRTTGRSGLVSSYDFADLPPASSRIEAPPPFSPPGVFVLRPNAAWHQVKDTESEEYARVYRIPLLSTVLARYDRAIINIDCKDDSEELADCVSQLLLDHNALHRVVVGSMHDKCMRRLKAQVPDAVTFFGPRAILGLYARFAVGLLPFFPLQHGALEIPFVTTDLRKAFIQRIEGRLGTAWATRLVDGLAWFMLRPALIRHLKARNVPVVVWVINSEEDMHRAYSMGVTGLMTDKPSLLKSITQ